MRNPKNGVRRMIGMWRKVLLSAVLASVPLVGFVRADTPPDASVDARLRDLERRVSDLERRLGEATKPAAASPAPAAPAEGSSAPVATGAAAVAPVPAAPAPFEPWRNAANWDQLHKGMSWSQVRKLLGKPGKVITGVFGDIWYFPDDSGGRVDLDRDGRVSGWIAPHAQ